MPYSHDQEGGLYQCCIQISPSLIQKHQQKSVLIMFDVANQSSQTYYYQSSYPSIPNEFIQATFLRPPRIATSLAPEHPQHLAAVTGEASSMPSDRRTVPSGQEKVSQVALWKARATSPSQGDEQREMFFCAKCCKGPTLSLRIGKQWNGE